MSGPINVNAPRGFKPTKMRNGNYWNGSATPYRLASGTAADIFNGDMVHMLTTGVITKGAVTAQFRGVAVGFQWVGLDGVPRVSPFWPTGTVTLGALPATALVVDDPDVLFEAVFNSASVPAVADIGANFSAVDAGGSAASGMSGQGINYSTLATSALPWRFEDFVARVDNFVGLANVRGLFSPQLHDYRVNTGI